MFGQATGSWKIVLSVLFFPLFFQDAFVSFAWGGMDSFWLMSLKRVFVLLPCLAVLLGCWLTSASALSLLVRQNRTEFLTSLLITWWDLIRSVFSFWGGAFQFVFIFFVSIWFLGRMVITGFWLLVIDAFLMPFRTFKTIGENVLNPGIPWIAVFLTLFWSFIEATIFTYVTSPLVIETLSNITGDQLSESFIQIPLFFFMLFIVLGSYSVLSTLSDAIRSRRIMTIIKIGVIELVALFVEVVFLYREFVDALIPWFAQHSSEDFELGIFGTLAIAGVAWLGIRSLSWFLFAGAGTPTIMAVIQRSGLKMEGGGVPNVPPDSFARTALQIDQIKKEMDWMKTKGEELLAAFLLPPLQIVACSINFITLLFTAQHLMPRQYKSLKEVMDPKMNLQKVSPPKAGKE